MIDPGRLSLLMDLDQMGTLTAVAEARFMSVSGVSQQLAALEKETKVRLLERHGRRVRLTEEGALLVRHGQGILASIEAAETDLRASRTEVAGTVELGAFNSAARGLLPRACRSLAARFPELRVIIHECESHQSLQRLERGSLDVAVVDSFAGQPLPKSNLHQESLMEDRLLVVLPPNHSLVGSPSLEMGELSGQDWLLEEDRTYLGGFVQRACAAAGFQPAVTARFQSADVGLALVAAGFGITILPELAVAGAPEVAAVPLAPQPQRQIVAVARHTNKSHPAVQAVITELRRNLPVS
ncbi:MAG TPA: LysR family transcriptional regulator [Arthrobacter sp.]|nr:LysR family transcriptional regulator [Arthrobacter sp.]